MVRLPLAILGGVLAFATVVVWRWPAPLHASAPPKEAATGQEVLLQSAHVAAVHTSVRALPTGAYDPPLVKRRDQVVSMESADVSAANIVPLLDDSDEEVAWRLASGEIIVAVNGRGVSTGGAGELARALESGERVRMTLARNVAEGTLTESTTSLSVSQHLLDGSVKARGPDCRLDPSQFSSADDYRRAVYVISSGEGAPNCTLPADWRTRR